MAPPHGDGDAGAPFPGLGTSGVERPSGGVDAQSGTAVADKRVAESGL